MPNTHKKYKSYSEVVHVNSPGHGTSVALLLDPVHFDLERLLVLVSDPLVSLVCERHHAGGVPPLGPAFLLLQGVANLKEKSHFNPMC